MVQLIWVLEHRHRYPRHNAGLAIVIIDPHIAIFLRGDGGKRAERNTILLKAVDAETTCAGGGELRQSARDTKAAQIERHGLEALAEISLEGDRCWRSSRCGSPGNGAKGGRKLSERAVRLIHRTIFAEQDIDAAKRRRCRRWRRHGQRPSIISSGS